MDAKIEKILIAVDFSEPSEKALAMGALLARRFQVPVKLLHVSAPVVVPWEVSLAGGVDLEAIGEEMMEKAKKSLEDLAAKYLGDLHAEIEVRQGDAASEILFVAEHGNIDLVVVATHGRSGLRRFVMGSVAEKIVRHAPCPVLSIRHETST